MAGWLERFAPVRDMVFPGAACAPTALETLRFPEDHEPHEVFAPAWAAGVPCLRIGDPEATWKVILFHGNYSTVAMLRPFAQLLAAREQAQVFMVEYPGYWKPDGGEAGAPTSDGVYAAALAAADAIGGPYHVFGFSLGASPATHLAAERPDAALSLTLVSPLQSVVLTGSAGMPRLLRALGRVLILLGADSLSCFADAPRVRCQTSIFHGDADDIIPCAGSKELALRFSDAALHLMPGVDHLDALDAFLDFRVGQDAAPDDSIVTI